MQKLKYMVVVQPVKNMKSWLRCSCKIESDSDAIVEELNNDKDDNVCLRFALLF